MLRAVLFALGVLAGIARAEPTVTFDQAGGTVVLTNGRLQLKVETKNGLDADSLRDLKSGRVYADAAYMWPDHQAPTLQGAPAIEQKEGACTVRFTGTAGQLTVVQTFSATREEPNAIRETIELRNATGAPLDTSKFACGFAKRVCDKNTMLAEVADASFCNVPYRRSEETGELQDYSVQDLITRASWFSSSPSPSPNRQLSPYWGAEG